MQGALDVLVTCTSSWTWPAEAPPDAGTTVTFPVPALQAEALPPLVVELPDEVVGREVVLDVVVRLDVVLDEVEVALVDDALVDVDTAGVGVGLELQPADTSNPAVTPSPPHTRPSLTSRMTST